MNALMDTVKRIPGYDWADAHPRLSAWIALATGMVILLVIEARNVGLEFGQWIALIVATVLVAGVCIWIVTWDDDDLVEEAEQAGDGE